MRARLPSLFAWALLFTAAGLSMAALLADLRREARVPSDDALREAVEVVRAGFRPGDAVLLRPSWMERPWELLRGAGPGTEEPPFPALLRGDRIDPVEVLRHERVWVIGAFGRAADPGLAAEDRAPVREEVVREDVRVALWELDSVELLARLTDEITGLGATRRHPDGRVTECPRIGEHHRCGLDPWLDPKLITRDVFHRDVRWLYAHPGPGAASLVLEWPERPRGAALLVRAGFTQMGVRHDAGTPTTVIVRLDGGEVDRFVLAPWTYALERRLVHLPPGGDSVDVGFEIQAEDPSWREVMLQADVLGRVPRSIAGDATAEISAP